MKHRRIQDGYHSRECGRIPSAACKKGHHSECYKLNCTCDCHPPIPKVNK